MTRDKLLKSLRYAGAVERYHTYPTLRKQTIADHTWNVLRIYTHVFEPPQVPVFMHIMYHDCGELVTGDVPFPFKRRNPNIGEQMTKAEDMALRAMGISLPPLSTMEKVRIKLCDLAEMHEFGLIEMALGNKLAQPIVDDTLRAINAMLAGSTEYLDVVDAREKLTDLFLQVKGE